MLLETIGVIPAPFSFLLNFSDYYKATKSPRVRLTQGKKVVYYRENGRNENCFYRGIVTEFYMEHVKKYSKKYTISRFACSVSTRAAISM